MTYQDSDRENQEILVGNIELLDARRGAEDADVFPLWDNAIFRIGRDPETNTLAIESDSDQVSRNHCEIYSIMYEPTMYHFYVRDRKSSNGTYVNGILVGRGETMSSGYLLENGDQIEIRPFWKFTFRQTMPPLERPLTTLQIEECKLFEKKYIIKERCLGYGSEAAVRLSIDVKTRKQLVCKLVSLDGTGCRDSCGKTWRKYQEADILRQLAHPNILPYVDAIVSPHTLYTFTELASGGDLTSFANRHCFIPEFNIRIIVRQITRGLQYLHANEIVHRDLKPENILFAFSPKIGYHRIMLADFGASAVADRNRMTTSVGTICYQAPEIHDNAQIQTTAVDMWSLGQVTLMLLSISGTVDVGDLSRLNQQAIDRFLSECFQTCDPEPSENGRQFVHQCLRVLATERLTSDEASCHDWFCTPDQDLERFKNFDRRMMTEYRRQKQLRPVPMELPDVWALTETCSTTALQYEADKTSRYFREKEEPVLGSQTESQVADASCEPVFKEEKPTQHLGAFQGCQTITGLQAEKYEAPLIERPGITSGPVPLMPLQKLTLCKDDSNGLPKPKSIIKHDRRNQSMRKKTGYKYHDAMFLPPLDLSCHTNPIARSKQRERILSKLGKTQTKFLSETSILMDCD